LPAVSLPKGGGAVRGIQEKLSPNPATGSLSLNVPIPTSTGRPGFDLALELSYDSSAGNGPFGLGWQLSVPQIARKTDKGLPRYGNDDVFVLSGAEDLVPIDAGSTPRNDGGKQYHVRRYRPRVEGLFARIERWTRNDGDVHWRVTTRDNVRNVYGRDPNARIADPSDPARVFSWLLEETRDDRGNIARYTYKKEDGLGVKPTETHEAHRFGVGGFGTTAQRYLKKIEYGNEKPEKPDEPSKFLFHVVFDYGEHDLSSAQPYDTPDEWKARDDRFSSHRSTFEVRTYRLCRSVLVFHDIKELDPTGPVLVRSTDFEYDRTPYFAYLTRVTQRGYVKSGNKYEAAEFPPLAMKYTPLELGKDVAAFDAISMDGLAAGALAGGSADWVDLDGEGLPGVLLATEQAHFYKRNEGGRLGPPVLERSLPAPREIRGPGTQLTDLEGDGNLDLVHYAPPLSGWFARTAEHGWRSFQPLPGVPRIDWSDPNLRFCDLSGDGHADLVLSEHDAFIVHLSRARDGFSEPERVPKSPNEDDGPRVLFADSHEAVFLADVSGDGLLDIVRVRSGEVCYWPSQGYGRFGRKVVLGGSYRFARPEAFDPKRVRLADVDGGGGVDVLYIGPDGVDLYRNQSGNALAPPIRVASLPALDSLTTVSLVDLFGRGTSCLVWASPSPATRPIAFIDLVGPKKPHLLERSDDGMGRSTEITYASSTEDYLRDRRAGRPWLTRLSFPVHVIREIVNRDAISRSTLRTTFAYHHGFFDGDEREFRGFARVDQWDDGEHALGGAGDPAESLKQPRIRTTTWFHTGAWLERERLERALAREYWSQDPDAPLLADTPALPGTTVREEKEAARALRGAPLRQEVYAEDGSARAEHPYSVSERSYEVKPLVAGSSDRSGVFLTHPAETFDVVYERNPLDPRVQHTLVLDVDEFGNVLEQAIVAYRRRKVDPALPASFQAIQNRTLITFTQSQFTHPVDDDTGHRGPLPAETRIYELTGLSPAAGRYLSPSDLRDTFAKATPLDYADKPLGAGPHRRRVEHGRTIYRADDLSAPLPLRTAQARAIPFETYSLAFTSKLLASTYRRDAEDLIEANVLETEGGYVSRQTLVANGSFPAADPLRDDKDDDWWMPSGRLFFSETPKAPAAELIDAEASFFLPCRAQDPFGKRSYARRGLYSLLPRESEDAVGNRTVVTDVDWRVLQPRVIEDPNKNREEVWFDALGLLIAVGRLGKATDKGDVVSKATAQGLMPEFSVAKADVDAFLANPIAGGAALVGKAGRRFVYDLFAYQRTRNQPIPSAPSVAAIARETHELEAPGAPSKHQIAFLYFDGFARTVQTKTLAEEDPAAPGPRWVGSGWVILDNHGNPVRKYEPFFSGDHRFEHGRKNGVAATLFYDPTKRVVGTLFPNRSYEKVVFDPWRQEHWDTNDTSATAPADDTDLRERMALLPAGDLTPAWKDRAPKAGREPQETKATKAAQKHGGTPKVTYLDALGRPYLSVLHNRWDDEGTTVDQLLPTFKELDIEGLERLVVDAKRKSEQTPLSKVHDEGREVMAYAYDIAGRRIRQDCLDAGARWTLVDATGQPIRAWDRLGRTFRTDYDDARRPTGSYVMGHDENDPLKEILTEEVIYGETQPNPEAGNLRGRAYEQRDAAGTLRSKYDFKGNLVSSMRQLAVEFRVPLDWSAAAPAMEPLSYETDVAYDALDHVKSITTHDKSRVLPRYGARGLLLTIDVELPGRARVPYVKSLVHDAKGQRERIEYGNGVVSVHEHDKDTFRLLTLTTTRTSGERLQKLEYTYDAVGNPTSVGDDATSTLFFDAPAISASNEYTYDALYQLRSATGHEHEGQQGAPDPDDLGRVGLAHPHDFRKMRRYEQTYSYDEVGNILSLVHEAVRGDYTRSFFYERASRLQSARVGNALTRTEVGTTKSTYSHDEHGNIEEMPHLPKMRWDQRDRLVQTTRQVVNAGTAETTYYVYDARGERVRKVTCAQATGARSKERIYLGGFEVFRTYDPAGNTVTERRTLHVMDGERRIALVESDAVATNVRFQLANHLGSSSVEVDDSPQARVVSHEQWHPFGTTAFQAQKNQTYAAKRYRFTGKERDEESGLAYHGARYYAPWLARWISADPAGLVDGPNRYEYVGNSPTHNIDPTGLYTWEMFGNDVKQGAKGAVLGIIEPALIVVDFGQMAAAVVTMKVAPERYHDVEWVSATGRRLTARPDQAFRSAVVTALAIPTGGASGLADNIYTVFTEDMTPDEQQSLLVQGAVGQVLSTGIAAGVSRGTGSGWTGRGPAPNPVAEQQMVNGLAETRRAGGDTGGAEAPKGAGDATYAQAQRGSQSTEVMASEKAPSPTKPGVHAEENVMPATGPKPGARTLAVDQTPCPGCQTKVLGNRAFGLKKNADGSGGRNGVPLPKMWQGNLKGATRVVVPQKAGAPGGSPKSAARAAAHGKSTLTPHSPYTVPYNPPITPNQQQHLRRGDSRCP
jgi:RHS repeat-associated protein